MEVDEVDEIGILQAQASALAWIHHTLPAQPVTWIIQYIDQRFLPIYLRFRVRWGTLRALALVMLCCCIVPWAYANTMMPYPCDAHIYKAQSAFINRNNSSVELTLQRTGCSVEDFLRSSSQVFSFGPYTSVAMSIVWWIIYTAFSKNRPLEKRLHMWLKPYLPAVFYNGVGPRGTGYHAWALFEYHGHGKEYSWLHDFFGASDYVTLCASLVAINLVSMVILSTFVAGVRGIPTGAAFGGVFARLILWIMNASLGASQEFVDLVHGELRTYRPERRLVHVRLGAVRESFLRAEVEKAAQVLIRKGAVQVGRKIRKRGFDVLYHVARTLLNRPHQRSEIHSLCYRLFTTEGTTFTTTEYGLAALGIIDCTCFLAAYFDPKQRYLGGIQWSNAHQLNTLYIANPRNVLITYGADGWECEFVEDDVEGDSMASDDETRELDCLL